MAEKKTLQTVEARVRSGQPYRRCGKVLSGQFQGFELTEKELAVFLADPHIELKETEKKPAAAKGQK